MAIGIRISNNVEVNLGEIKERLLADLDNSGLEYSIPFDKLNKNNIKETIITIKDLSIEISVENDIITYIKSDNNEFTNLDKIESIEENVLNHIQNIKDKIASTFKKAADNLKIEKIDTKTMNMVVILTDGDTRARVTILREGLGNVYINTLRAI